MSEAAAAVAELGLASVVFSPGESLDPEDAARGVDYLAIMDANLDRLAEALAD